jgi:hypothetical protein
MTDRKLIHNFGGKPIGKQLLVRLKRWEYNIKIGVAMKFPE